MRRPRGRCVGAGVEPPFILKEFVTGRSAHGTCSREEWSSHLVRIISECIIAICRLQSAQPFFTQPKRWDILEICFIAVKVFPSDQPQMISVCGKRRIESSARSSKLNFLLDGMLGLPLGLKLCENVLEVLVLSFPLDSLELRFGGLLLLFGRFRQLAGGFARGFALAHVRCLSSSLASKCRVVDGGYPSSMHVESSSRTEILPTRLPWAAVRSVGHVPASGYSYSC